MLDEGWLSGCLRVAAIGLLLAHIWQFAAYPAVMNLRTSIAVTALLLVVIFAGRLTGNRYAVPLLQLFGVLGAGTVMAVLHASAT